MHVLVMDVPTQPLVLVNLMLRQQGRDLKVRREVNVPKLAA